MTGRDVEWPVPVRTAAPGAWSIVVVLITLVGAAAIVISGSFAGSSRVLTKHEAAAAQNACLLAGLADQGILSGTAATVWTPFIVKEARTSTESSLISDAHAVSAAAAEHHGIKALARTFVLACKQLGFSSSITPGLPGPLSLFSARYLLNGVFSFGVNGGGTYGYAPLRQSR